MTHLDASTLRRGLDEPESLTAAAKAHLDRCSQCRALSSALAVDAGAVATLLAVPAAPVDASRAFKVFQATAVSPPAWTPTSTGIMGALPWRQSRTVLLSLALAALAVVSGALVVTGTAQSMLSIFEPKQFVPVPVQPASFASLPDLAAYGTMHISREPVIHQPESAASASSAAGLHVLVP